MSFSRRAKDPCPEEYKACFDLGIIQVATCAAELPGLRPSIEKPSSAVTSLLAGIPMPLGRRWAGFEAGMRHVDHFWCAMSSISGLRQEHGFPCREHGAVCVDGTGHEKSLPTASTSPLNYWSLPIACWGLIGSVWSPMPIEPWTCRRGNSVWPREDGVWFESDGKVGFVSRDALASSVVGMDTMVRNMFRNTSASLPEAVRMGSLTPARRVGMDSQIGSLEAGKQAVSRSG